MKNSLSSNFVARLSAMTIVVGFCILSCEEHSNTSAVLPKKMNTYSLFGNHNARADSAFFGVSTCLTDSDLDSCDSRDDNDQLCECKKCNKYCDDLTSRLFYLTQRGRICGKIGGCLDPDIKKLILYFIAEKLPQQVSLIKTKTNKVFAKSRVINFDQQKKIVVIGYDVITPQLAKEELFIQINTNYIHEDGEFRPLNLRSEAIPAKHFVLQ